MLITQLLFFSVILAPIAALVLVALALSVGPVVFLTGFLKVLAWAPVVMFLLFLALNVASTLTIGPAMKIIDKSNMTEEDKAVAKRSMKKGRKAAAKTLFYDASSFIVMALVIPFVKREAEKLPKAFSKWDNNVSLNGDGQGWQDTDGKWYDTRERECPPGFTPVWHYDPAYGGDCYYAKGHHPRSLWARYTWVGLRNRASKLSLDLGVDVKARAVLMDGNPKTTRNGVPGFFIYRDQDNYQCYSVKKAGPVALITNYGYKINVSNMHHESKLGRVAVVAIGFTFKRWKKAEA